VRIDSRNSQPLHFLVCDGNGGCAAIEFLSGRMVVHKGDELPVTAMTNNTYEYSVQFVNTCEGDENSTAFASGSYSNKRFFWAASGIKDWEDQPSSSPVDYAFDILEKVSQDHTVFRIVYDVGNRRIYFRTLSNPAIKHFDYGAFDFSCATPVKMLDMASELHGDVTALFSDYEYDANYDLIAAAFRETEFLKHIPETTLRYIAAYPESLQCVVR
jgi:choloylglycine hydrolase